MKPKQHLYTNEMRDCKNYDQKFDSGDRVTACESPVFVIGCPRSGTTLFYHMLLSSGGFAYYRAETHIFDLIGVKFRHLERLHERKKLLDFWLNTEEFKRSGLNADDFEDNILRECRNPGDFLRIFMDRIAAKQGVSRWAECTPTHALHIDQIKKSFPNALFVHMIRDGRDVALSLERQRWISPLPWHKSRGLAVAALYWKWLVRRGRTAGAKLGNCYREVRFEDLVLQPAETLQGLEGFLNHKLDYNEIQQKAIGSVARPNTSFASGSALTPVNRWQKLMSLRLVDELEALTGGLLGDLGYDCGRRECSWLESPWLKSFEWTYLRYFQAKYSLKTETPLGRLTNPTQAPTISLPSAPSQ